VREPFDWPLCVFYSAALAHLLVLSRSTVSSGRDVSGAGDGVVIAVSVITEPR
jgi:hypothetical protein